LDVTDVVDDEGVKALKPGDSLRELQIALCDQMLSDQSEGRNEKDLELVAVNPFTGRGGYEMTFAAAGEPEAEQIIAAANKGGL